MGNNDQVIALWKNRTLLEKILVTLLVIAFILIVIFIALFATALSANNDICMDANCVHSAHEVLNFIDESIDPCDNFYEFACGNFLNSTNLDNSETDEIIESKMRRQIRDIVEEPIEPKDPKYLVAVKMFYHACMNESAIESENLNRLKGILKDIGGWPLLDGHNWRETHFDWESTVRKLRKIGINFDPFFKFSIDINRKNPEKYILNLQMPEIPEYMNESLTSYRNYIVDIGKLLGADHNRVVRETNDFLQFQQELFQISNMPEENTFNPMTIMYLQQVFPKIQWYDYINGILYPASKINMDETVTISEPGYLSRLEDLLQRTPKRVLANFISWNTVLYLIPFLKKEVREEIYEYEFESYYRNFKEMPRWEQCIQTVTESLKMPVSATYIKKYFSEEDRVSVEEIIKLIKSQFENVIKSLDWMDENTKETALAKLSNVAEYISGPEELDENELLNEIYDAVEIYEDKYLASALNIDFLNANLRYEKLHRQVNDSFWVTIANNAISMNARYEVKQNSLLLPVGILQGLYFNRNRPMYLNYGTLGSIIAREISHMFIEGKNYDEHDNYTDWWSPSTYRNYNNKASCLSEQYNNFTIPELEPKFNLISNQETADLAGAKIAYEAYKLSSYLNEEESILPGLNYNKNQLFWISFALNDCSKTTPEDGKIILPKYLFFPSKFRVVGPLRNLEDFADDFDCPLGSFMNPPEKCEIW